MVVTLTGNNAHALNGRLGELSSGFIKKYGELALEKIDAEEAEPQVIFDAVANLPFLSEKKMVIVRNLGANKTAAEKIEQLIDSTHEGVELILHEPVTDKRTAYYKTLKTRTQLENFNEMEPHSLAKWLVDEARKQGGEITQTDAACLIERVGQNQSLLANELAKLITYEPKITRETIELLSVKAPQGRVFDLLDAAFSGNKKKALDLYEEQRAQKVEPQEIIAMLAWQLRLVAAAQLAGDKKPADIARDFNLSAYPVSKAQGIAKKLPSSKVRKLIFEAERIDKNSKTRPINLDEALRTYITTL